MGDGSVEYGVLERILARTEDPRNLPLETLKRITQEFSEDRIIGYGGFGVVYKGVLPNGSVVAVKRITVNSHTLDDKLFDREVKSLLKVIDHPNVVRFLGFCYNTDRGVIRSRGLEDILLPQKRERLLCFDYISNRSLDKHITDELRGLNWNIRYQIIKGICEGLQHLHKTTIIHMDLKPTNIMVDNDMVPKITDFGLARSDGKSHTAGDRFISRGYTAPEFENSGSTTFQCDIYSLGAIINELLTGRKGSPDKNNVLRRWRHRLQSSGNRQLLGQQVTKCIEIAERCMDNEPAKRPLLATIIDNLDKTGSTNAHNSAVGQVSPSWWDDDDMLGIEPLELHFAFEMLNKKISNELVLTNETGNCIAFSISTESLLQYCTEPKKGIVPPRSKSTVKITLEVQGKTTLRSMPGDDKFIVQSTRVKGGLTVEEIKEDMFHDKVGKVVDEVILTVVYDDKTEEAQADQPPVSVVSKSRGQGRAKRQRLNFRPPLHISTSTNMNDMALKTGTVSAMTGAMGRLRHKLLELLKAEHILETNVKKDIKSLERQLMSMHAGLYNLSRTEDQLDGQDKEWANDMRELSYEIEDIVDDLVLRMGQSELSTNQDFLKERLEVIKERVKEVSAWHDTYKIPDSMATHTMPSNVAPVDPRMLDWYKDHKQLVGIDGQLNELVERLAGRDDRDMSKQNLNIISIFGEGGLGKTTLAKAVFHKISAMEFVLKAFVPVGRNPNINGVLKNILIEQDKNTNGQILNQEWEQWQLTDKIRNVLNNKRYFIIIDDIWDTNSWEIIRCALIDNDSGSRVMTTSRIYDVAKSSGEVCKLEPLSAGQSRQLFYSRLTHKSTSDQQDKQSTEYILDKCGGLPLAIITIARLLDGKRVEDWPKVYKSIKFGHEDNKAENTKKILLFSYFDLPCHLKTCLLYLSIYPEDSVIEKRKLVWKWIAEGFVRQEEEKTLFEVGEGYFNELINRSLIQPVQFIEDWRESQIETGTISACRVHDMVLDLICFMAKEENFVTILDTDERNLSSENNARILAVHKSVLEERDMVNMCIKQQVMRSFNASDGCDLNMMGLHWLLPSFRVLRVLSLEDCDTVSRDDSAYCLKIVAHLRHLRCLSLAGTSITKLPKEIGDLRCLQILDLMLTGIEELPQSVTQLRELKSLICYNYDLQTVKLPEGMGRLTSLEELRLSCLVVSDIYSPDVELTLRTTSATFEKEGTSDVFFQELGNLTELRVLQIDICGFPGRFQNKALVDSLNKLKMIKELDVYEGLYPESSFTMWDDYSPCKVLLRHLCLQSTKMPVWIDASLGNLFCLELYLTDMTAQDLFRLGCLPELRSLYLKLKYTDNLDGTIVASSAGAFPKLRHLKTTCWLNFVPEAMQCLESLKLELKIKVENLVKCDFDSLQCLHSLEKVDAFVWRLKTGDGDAIEAALRSAVDNHPNGPILDKWYPY